MVVTQPDLPRPAADWLKGRRRLEAASSGGPQPMAMARGGVFAGNDEVTQRNLSTSDLVSFASDAMKSLQPALGVFGSGGIQTRDGAAFAKLIGTDFESQLAAEQYGPCSPDGTQEAVFLSLLRLDDKKAGELDAEAFFAPGHTLCCAYDRCLAALYIGVCDTSQPLSITKGGNNFCTCAYNYFCGASVGRYISPPCYCGPPELAKAACICCLPAEDRCGAMTFMGQHTAHAASIGPGTLYWKAPPTVTEEESYLNIYGPWTRISPRFLFSCCERVPIRGLEGGDPNRFGTVCEAHWG